MGHHAAQSLDPSNERHKLVPRRCNAPARDRQTETSVYCLRRATGIFSHSLVFDIRTECQFRITQNALTCFFNRLRKKGKRFGMKAQAYHLAISHVSKRLRFAPSCARCVALLSTSVCERIYFMPFSHPLQPSITRREQDIFRKDSKLNAEM